MRSVFASVALVALLSACAGVPKTRYYELRLPSQAAGQGTGLTVGVRTFTVDPPYDQDRIVYRIGEDSPEIGFYAYHRWAVPLAAMLSTVTARALRGTAGIASIEPLVPGRSYDVVLEGRLLALEEIDLPAGQRVRVRLELRLVREDGNVSWSETFASENTARLSEVREVVERMVLAVDDALGQARDSLGRALGESA